MIPSGRPVSDDLYARVERISLLYVEYVERISLLYKEGPGFLR
jgi:hypothetical protein